MDRAGAAVQGVGVRSGNRIPRYFDNSPVRCMLEHVHSVVRRLGFEGCEVEQVKVNGLKASILVATPGALQEQFRTGEYSGLQWGAVRVLWRAAEPHDSNQGVGDD